MTNPLTAYPVTREEPTNRRKDEKHEFQHDHSADARPHQD